MQNDEPSRWAIPSHLQYPISNILSRSPIVQQSNSPIAQQSLADELAWEERVTN